jgi:deoxycytidylate deaminase
MNTHQIIRHLPLLTALAETADDHRSRHAAAIIYRNRIIALGTNHFKTHPFQIKYRRRPDAIYLHAEVAAIKRAIWHLSEKEMRRAILISVRIKYDNQLNPRLGISKPCEGCQRAIAEFGIRHVYYTTENQEIEML